MEETEVQVQPKFTVLDTTYAKELYKAAQGINTGTTYSELTTTGKTIVSAINELQSGFTENKVTVDQTVISGSTNAVAGGAVYDEVQRVNENDLVQYVLGQETNNGRAVVTRNYDIDEVFIEGSHNPVASHVIQKALSDLTKALKEQLGLTLNDNGILCVTVNEEENNN